MTQLRQWEPPLEGETARGTQRCEVHQTWSSPRDDDEMEASGSVDLSDTVTSDGQSETSSASNQRAQSTSRVVAALLFMCFARACAFGPVSPSPQYAFLLRCRYCW